MSFTKLDPEAEIIPAVGLGGLSLRTHVRELNELILRFHTSQTAQKLQCNLYVYEARYAFLGTGIEVAVDVRNGKISKLIAREGYRGKLFGRIVVGMPVREVMTLDPRLYYDEGESVISCKGVDGVSLCLPVDDAFAHEIWTMTVDSIVVYAPEVFTAQGLQGLW